MAMRKRDMLLALGKRAVEKVQDKYENHIGRYTQEYYNNASRRRVLAMLVHAVYFRDLITAGALVATLLGYKNERAESYSKEHWEVYPCSATDEELKDLGLAFFLRRDPHPTEFAPKLAIVLRGTLLYKCGDLVEDLRIAMETHQTTRRVQRCQELCRDVIQRFLARPTADQSICITGHSLGAGVGHLVGKHLVSSYGLHIDTHLFNPPLITFASIATGHALPSGRTNYIGVGMFLSKKRTQTNPQIHEPVRQTDPQVCQKGGPGILASAWVKMFGGEALQKEWEEFQKLQEWKPHLYLNASDVVCLQYIKYYKKRHENANKANVVGTQGIITRVFGKNAKYISNVVPTAELYMSKLFHGNPVLAHSLLQWHKCPELDHPDNLSRITARLLHGHGHGLHFRQSARHVAHRAHNLGRRH